MYAMILPASLAPVLAAEAAIGRGERDAFPVDVTAADADRALAAVRTDYGRASRFLLGLCGTAGAAVAALALAFVTELLVGGGGPAAQTQAMTAVTLAIAAILAVPSVLLLLRLHASGRRLARATGYWAALPYRAGARRPERADYFTVRFVAFSADLFPRVISSALAMLAAVFSVSLTFYAAVVVPDASLLTAAVGWSGLSIAVMIGQFGGVQRIQNGYSARDPWGFDRRRRHRLRRGGPTSGD